MKILVFINHFYGKNPFFKGKSTVDPEEISPKVLKRTEERRSHLQATIRSLRTLSETVDIRICGYQGKSLMDLDFDFDEEIDKPTDIMYASLLKMSEYIEDYDYFINIEDDILLERTVFERIVSFDQNSQINEILHPNRLEKNEKGKLFCIDLKCIPGWTYNQRIFQGKKFRQALNPHSGLAIFRKDKFRFALANSDIHSRSIHLYLGMDSAFASIHSPFILWRSFEEEDFHSVFHQDKWIQPKKDLITSITLRDFIPMVIPKILKYLALSIGIRF
ncbi:hypothetical protein JWG44_17165 [Leptospira sp. 201903071]|uniref:hypothetical protein n=1 Tax=Leptospira ainazelensis TaxID=2810034 RepID=UPI001965BAEE|nr:hypothetical protein [Leptospira ainazelensis]MBM9501989.1 hypothetical protein [Leptospira ainazelensis]